MSERADNPQLTPTCLTDVAGDDLTPPAGWHLAFVALGANLDDPQQQVRAASDALGELSDSRLQRLSSLYRTAPVGVRAQPDFINAVAALHSRLPPESLLEALFAVERQFGRRREFHHAPRTLDLDLLLYDRQCIDSPRLCVPHPRMHLRAFVLVPLLEIAPGCLIPGRGPAAAWLPAVSGQAIQRLSR
ncbi:MAG TPA: 2-amino-4-hydroxy-6-hydroxymethyldihydropteridine diphosphokinase [Accumulibacter sp.]|nr:2-amino-4-hydroxy-6-hydroxymethyldihydropteridine diphosphokinase [Accumulibacter sp.]HMW16274.1 2-amino-4-hydroxy-6-hydroxymethyldihydropteridine diphosphokinase [Accumulibacter sp.]HMY06891.1 2-amino-4-hydroxy-6-hydroxymethyldihydropteridine diphosphokinase [Accumulibacter sp.]HNC16963.1 2-amino-4-hydroxy-6-hydroxymethyldihydropteridine diphosphokinase [Accumulibacter sp.]HND79047.1 2-amino-4-hydroxy-6-hydroxymethyldihydropteridine diphosphokinase [Accumulibacter sp.]